MTKQEELEKELKELDKLIDMGSIYNDFFGKTVSNAKKAKEAADFKPDIPGMMPLQSGKAQKTDAPQEAQSEPQPAEEEDPRTLEELQAELDSLIGLQTVKEDVKSLLNFIKVNQLRKERDMKTPTVSYHLVFTGNPGTGKTTVARLLGRMYYRMGLLPKGQLIEADRSTLVAGYMGQTAIKTQEVIQRAMGGVLFIDEAYSLAEDEKDSFGREAIETILKAMEDHRDELVVIVAGYTDLMHKFIDSNPGLESRFNKYFEFPDYTGEELYGIYELQCRKNGYKLTEDAAAALKTKLCEIYEVREPDFGNARDVRNMFEKAIGRQANRLALLESVTDEDLETLNLDDIAIWEDFA